MSTTFFDSSVATKNLHNHHNQHHTTKSIETTNYENDKNVDTDFDEPENKKFILQPTPAQLGQAPLQRRKNLGGSKFEIINQKLSSFIIRFFYIVPICEIPISTTAQPMSITNVQTSMPSALPTPNSATIDDVTNQLSPSMKKSFFKKNKGDDMDQ